MIQDHNQGRSGRSSPERRTCSFKPNTDARKPIQTDPLRPRSRRTWWICGFLFLGTVLNYLDRQVLALTAEKIMAAFGLNSEGLGRIIALFRYAYGIGQIFGGFIVDGAGPRLVYPVAGGLWSLAGMLTGFASSVVMLSLFRFTLGIGEAFNWPCALKVTHQLVPPEDRTFANGIFNSGSGIGALIAPIIVTSVAIYHGWRAAFVATGALGIFWVVGWIWYTQSDLEQMRGTPITLAAALRISRNVLSLRSFWVLAVSAIIINGVSYFLSDWIPLYLKTVRGFSFTAGNGLSILVYAGSSTGSLLIGLLVRKLADSGLVLLAAKKSALFTCCLLMLCAISVGLTSSRLLAVGGLVATALGGGGFVVVYQTLLQDIDPANVGVVAGLLGGLGNLVYGYLSPYIGLLADLKKTSLTLTIVGLLPWLAFAAILWGVKVQE